MAPPDRRSSLGIDRRASTTMPTSYTADDDYDLEPAGVADGFRPVSVVVNHVRIPTITMPQPQDPFQDRRTPPPRPSSTSKPNRNSLTLRHDGAMGPIASRTTSIAAFASGALPTRSSSVSTDAAFVRSESPYRGPTGPSHPYQMYAQDAQLTRTASMATTSTIRPPERSYQGPNGPTHPYGLYPQNTVPEADAASQRAPPVQVGFPGRNNDYHRRLGPDGEEVADIIGPDGHTEQLPPYSQYPDEAFARKTRPAVAVIPPGAGGIGLATRNPEFSSQEDLSAPLSRRSTRSIMSDSTHNTNIIPVDDSEKPELKKWQRIARKRLCGIVPIWAIVLVLVTLILFIIIVVGVLAALWHKHSMNNKQHHNSNSSNPASATMSTTLDASAFSTPPTDLPILPTGTFQLSLPTPTALPNSCVNAAQSNAWSCLFPPLTIPYQMEVSFIGGVNPAADNDVLLGWGNNPLNSWSYGAQPPVLHRPQPLFIARDVYDPKRGPAWFFQAFYDKMVIVEENKLSAPTSNSKREAHLPERDTYPDFTGNGVAMPGENPWFCYWNNTLLEAFLYVNDTSSAGASMSASTSTAPPPTTSTYSSGPTKVGGQGSWPMMPPTPTFIPYYSKVVKIEERRIASQDLIIPPYCVKQRINGNGQAQTFMDDTGHPVIIYLNETEPLIAEPLDRRSTGLDGSMTFGRSLSERTPASCACAWIAE